MKDVKKKTVKELFSKDKSSKKSKFKKFGEAKTLEDLKNK